MDEESENQEEVEYDENIEFDIEEDSSLGYRGSSRRRCLWEIPSRISIAQQPTSIPWHHCRNYRIYARVDNCCTCG